MPKSAKSTPTKPAKHLTLEEVGKVQSRFAKAHGGKVPKGSWIGRLQRLAQHNAELATTNDPHRKSHVQTR